MSSRRNSTLGSSKVTNATINQKRLSGPPHRPHAAALLLAAVAAVGIFGAAEQSQAVTTLYWNPANGTAIGGNGNWDATDTYWNASATPTASSNVVWASADAADFAGTVSGTNTVTLTTPISAAGLTFANATAGTTYTLTGSTITLASGSTISLASSVGGTIINSVIAGSNFTITPNTGTLNNRTTLQLTLGGANTFTGTMTINNKGVVAITSGSALGASNNSVSLSNSTLQYQGTGETISGHNIITSTNTGVQDTLDSDGTNALIWSGNYTTTAATHSLQLGGVTGWMNTFSGTIAGSTTSQVILNASGDAHTASSWYLSNTGNTYGGGTSINSGTLQIAGDGSLGTATGTLTLNYGAVIKGDGNSAISLSASRGVVFSGTAFTIDGGGQNFTVNGPITSNLGSGTNTLTVQNLGSGGVLSLAQVTINPSNQQTMGSARTLALASGAGAGSNVSIAGLTHNNPANLPENFTLSSTYTGTATITGPSTITGNITVSPGTGGQLVIKDNKALGFGGNYNLNNSIGTVTVSSGSLDLYGSTVNKVINLTGGTLINSNTGAAAVISNGIAGVTFTSGGSGFSMADVGAALTFTGGGSGSGAAASITSLGFGSGTLTASGGTGWVTGNTITVSGGNSALGATYTVTAASGAITGLTLASAGFGFTSATGLTYTGAKGSQSSFSGAGATYAFHDSTLAVANIATSASGSGYTATPTITGTASTTGSGLTASVTNSYVWLGTATSQIGGAGDITINAPIYGAAGIGFTKTGADTLTLAGASSYTGATTVSAGTLSLTGSLSGTAITVGTNGTFTEASTGAIAGTTGLTTSGTTTLVGTSNTYTGSTTVSGGTLTITGTSTAPTTLASPLVLNTGGTINANSYSTVTGFTDNSTTAATFSGVIADPTSGKGTVTATAGNLTLSGANTYTGVTTINGGTLTLSDNNSLGTAPSTFNGGQLVFATPSADTLAIAGNVTIDAKQGVELSTNLGVVNATINVGANVLTINSPVWHNGATAGSVLTIDSTGSGYVDIHGGILLAPSTGAAARVLGISVNGNLTVDSAISNYTTVAACGVTFSTTSGGTTILSGTNTYTGTTTVNSGTLDITGTVASPLVLNSGAISLTGAIAGTKTITINGGTFTGSPVANSSPITLNYNATDPTTLQVGSDALLGSSNVLTINGGTVTASGAAHAIAATTYLGANNDSSANHAFAVGGSNDLTFSGLFRASSTSLSTVSVTNTGTTTFSGLVATNKYSNNTGRGLAFTGSGNIVLSGTFGRQGDGTNGTSSSNVYAANWVQGTDWIETAQGFTGTLSLAHGNLNGGQMVIRGGTVLASTNDNVAIVTLPATGTSGSATIGVSDTSALSVGLSVGGAGVLAGSYILSIVPNTSITIGNGQGVSPNLTANNSSVTVGQAGLFGDSQLLGSTTVLLGDTTGNANASLLINGNYTVARGITLQNGNTGTMTLGLPATAVANTTGIYSGAITLGSGTNLAKDVTLSAPANTEVDFTGGIKANGTSTANVTITGGGTIKFAAANSYTGTTTINAATLDLGTTNQTVGTVTLQSGSIAATGGDATHGILTASNFALQSGSIAATLGGNGALTKTTSATVTLANLPSGSVAVNGGELQVTAGSSANILETLTTLTFASDGKLDLTNHDLLVTNGLFGQTLDTYRGKVTTQTAVAGAPSAPTTIALVSGKDYKAVTGTSALNDTDLYGKFTFKGDANLDGKISADDYLALDVGYLFGLTGWTHGDFEQTGKAPTAADYADIDLSYQNQNGKTAAAGEIALHTQWFGAAYTEAFNALIAPAVPEPASLGLLAAGALAMLRRKSRK